MDISTFIGGLLLEHDCVIIPGFGGFICNYKPAEIHPILHTVSPPSKSISFNRNLKSNDGLLINFIAERGNVSFTEAGEMVNTWVKSSLNLLKKGEDVLLRKIGKLHHDIEGNLLFAPDETTNYLKSSFGLRTITVEPIMHGKMIDFTEKFQQETKHVATNKKSWRIAAMILLLAGIATIAQLMWTGVEIKRLNLDEANVFSFMNRIFKAEEPEIKPLLVEITSSIVAQDTAVVENTEPANSETVATPTNSTDSEPEVSNAVPVQEENSSTASPYTYYVMIGAFAEEKNIEAAKLRLQQKFPDSVILVEKGKRLTKLGFSAGNNFYKAKAQLESAQEEDASYWLLKR